MKLELASFLLSSVSSLDLFLTPTPTPKLGTSHFPCARYITYKMPQKASAKKKVVSPRPTKVSTRANKLTPPTGLHTVWGTKLRKSGASQPDTSGQFHWPWSVLQASVTVQHATRWDAPTPLQDIGTLSTANLGNGDISVDPGDLVPSQKPQNPQSIKQTQDETNLCTEARLTKHLGRDHTHNLPQRSLKKYQSRKLHCHYGKAGSIEAMHFREYIVRVISVVLDKIPCANDMKFILKHLQQVAEDTNTHDWMKVFDWTSAVLAKISNGEITWPEEHKISMDTRSRAKGMSNQDRYVLIPCPDYNANVCPHEAEHVEAHFRLAHICELCYALVRAKLPHQYQTCHRHDLLAPTLQSQPKSNYAANTSILLKSKGKAASS